MKSQIKNYKKYILSGLTLLIFALAFTSCEKRWEDMNTDPNRLTDIPDEYLFTNAVRGAFRSGLGNLHVEFGGQYAHVFVGNVWKRAIDKYSSFNSQSDFPEEIYTSLYQGPIRSSLETMILTSDGKYANPLRYAQAQIINGMVFTSLTDQFGDVPYTEGGRAKYGFLKPKYDEQEFIYSDIIEKLGQSIEALKTGDQALAYPSGIDPIYHGNVENWIRMANTFRLRMALRAVNADPVKYSAIINECLSELLIEDNSQNATLTNWESENGALYNPWYSNIINYRADIYLLLWSEYFIELLKTNEDPRLPFFATKNSNGEYLGMPNGLVDNHQSLPSYATWVKAETSRPTEEFFAQDQPLYLVTAAETWLMRAELVLRGFGSGDADEMYKKGIRMNMEQWEIDETRISEFLSSNVGQLSGSVDENIERIATQLYISYVPNALESWSTIRRTGYPVIPRRTAENLEKGVTDGYMPKRINYPSTIEANVNGDNIRIAIDRMGGEDRIDLPVWWGLK